MRFAVGSERAIDGANFSADCRRALPALVFWLNESLRDCIKVNFADDNCDVASLLCR
jgi:hypothetical protein